MLRRLTARERFEQLLELFTPMLRVAFMEAVDDIRSNAELGRIIERMERGDIEGALTALHLDPMAFRPFDRAIAEAFNGGGVAIVGDLPQLREPSGGRAVVRFDVRNVAAESWLRNHSTSLITNVVADQQEGIRSALQAGLGRGENPTKTALDVVGRINRATGKREGGIIGLSSPQMQYVASARAELSSGNPADMRKYLTRERRDKRYDRTILKAIAEGKPLPAATVNRLVGRYSNLLLELRGTTIARTETMAALGESKKQAILQAIEQGSIDPELVTKVWRSAPATREARVQHQAMNRQEVPFLGRFLAPDGTLIDYPGDPAAGVKHTANCRCDWDVRMDFFAGVD